MMDAQARRRFKRMVEATKRNAYNNGQPWSDDDILVLANGISKDLTTKDMCDKLGRSYYAVQGRRGYLRFAMDHIVVLNRIAGSNVTPIRKKRA